MTGSAAAGPVPGLGLGLFLVALAVQRTAELVHSARNVARLRERGARSFGAAHFPLIVLVHVLFPACVVAEVLWLGARPGPAWPAWLGLVVAAQALRFATMRALGERWTVGIWVLPGEPLVRRGPYRLLPHPAYLAVVLELLGAPMMFGAWRTAIGIGALDLVALRIRVGAEERALLGAGTTGPPDR